MRTLALLFLGVVVGWAASGVDWSRKAVGQERGPIQVQEGGPTRLTENPSLLKEAIAEAQRQHDEKQAHSGETQSERYKALERVDIEKLGGRTNDRNLKYLSAGLNALAAEGWTLVAIEPAQRYTISGPGNASGTTPATYIFERRQ